MSKTKEMLGDNRGESAMDNKHLDDEYQYQQWCEAQETRKQFGDPPPVSECCNDGIIFGNGYPICKTCLKICNIKNE